MDKIKVIVKRPKSHYVIIISYILAPIMNVLLVRIFGNVAYSSIFNNFFNGFGLFAGLWLLTAPIVGIGFFFVHKVSWYIFIFHSCLILIDFIVKWLLRPLYYMKTISGSHNILMVVGNLLLVIIVGYIIQKDFRAPYFQALQRHWRESVRIPINHYISIDGTVMEINDLSPGGCFVLRSENDLQVNSDHSISFKSDLLDVSCTGQIMRQTHEGYGIMFKNISNRYKKDIQRFLKKRFALRQKINLKAQWGIDGILNDVVLLDISKGGCFIASRTKDIAEGDSGTLNVLVYKKNQRVHGKVTWINNEGEHNKPEGFGCSFRTNQKRLLKQILEEHGNLDYTR